MFYARLTSPFLSSSCKVYFDCIAFMIARRKIMETIALDFFFWVLWKPRRSRTKEERRKNYELFKSLCRGEFVKDNFNKLDTWNAPMMNASAGGLPDDLGPVSSCRGNTSFRINIHSSHNINVKLEIIRKTFFSSSLLRVFFDAEKIRKREF